MLEKRFAMKVKQGMQHASNQKSSSHPILQVRGLPYTHNIYFTSK